MNVDSYYITLVIILMALPVWLVRLAGFWMARHFKLNKVFMTWLECLPGCILMAIVAPLLLQADWIGRIAAASVIVVMIKTDKLLYAMIVGMVVAAMGHAIII